VIVPAISSSRMSNSRPIEAGMALVSIMAGPSPRPDQSL
jgi:hypothetical protein